MTVRASAFVRAAARLTLDPATFLNHAKNRFAMRTLVDDRFGSVIVAARAGHRVNPRDLNPPGLGQFRLRTHAYGIIIGNKGRKNSAFFGKTCFFQRMRERNTGKRGEKESGVALSGKRARKSEQGSGYIPTVR